MPVLGNDGGSFSATSFGMNGYYGIGNGGNTNLISGTATGTWGIGIQFADVSFVEDLSHTLRFAYYRGTNDSAAVKNSNAHWPMKWYADGMYLTDMDSVFEVNFDHRYQIYENLEAVLELGYLHLDADKGTWRKRSVGQSFDSNDDAWKAEINFRYSL